MSNDDTHKPRYLPQVAVSSTFMDLAQHRAALIKCLKDGGLAEAAMENSSAKLVDVIEASLTLVRDAAAYVGVISRRYGDTPVSTERNPEGLSLTELEFNEALRLGRPILLFIMSDQHLGRQSDFEHDPNKLQKLFEFRERAKRMSPGSAVHRVYAEFNSLDEFKEKIGPSIAELRRHLDAQAVLTKVAIPPVHGVSEIIPLPPALYAEPDYIGSHKFVGRRSQLQELSDWSLPADPHSVLLFEAIGGTGKSMLTWEWMKNHAPVVRTDWAGRFWYSFYERGAIMADFCQRALAYMTGEPLAKYRTRKTRDLTKELISQLHSKPWLLVLDGLERVLVAYHRIDAAELADNETRNFTDNIANRDSCASIRDEDDDLLRLLAASTRSKTIISSRLTPRVLLNASGQPIPGVRRISLPGLRPYDAEALLRSCDIIGNSAAIQEFLSVNCDCHPLVVGVLAGLINNYLPDKGNFDAWVSDTNGGNHLDFANLNLVQRRNHILSEALDALPDPCVQLLSTLALLPESIDYLTLAAINPFISTDAQIADSSSTVGDAETPERETKALSQSARQRSAVGKLTASVLDLQQRGMLQYDSQTRRYDLHPVVRSIAAHGMKKEDRERLGDRVIDYFSRQFQSPYEEAQTFEDVRNGINLVRMRVKIGDFEQAAKLLDGDLANALLFNLEMYPELVSLLKPYYPFGWDTLPVELARSVGIRLSMCASIALDELRQLDEGLSLAGACVSALLDERDWRSLCINLRNIQGNLASQNLLAKASQVSNWQMELASAAGEDGFLARLALFSQQARTGQWSDAEAVWREIETFSRPFSRSVYRPGKAETRLVQFRFWNETLSEDDLETAEQLATSGKNRMAFRELCRLRGFWRMTQGEWELATTSLQSASQMAHERGMRDIEVETNLALAKFHLRQLAEPEREAQLLAQEARLAHRPLAMLWQALGSDKKAISHAIAAYRWAWADGEPNVNRYELTQTIRLLEQLGTSIPKIVPANPKRLRQLGWEDDIQDIIERLRARSLDAS